MRPPEFQPDLRLCVQPHVLGIGQLESSACARSILNWLPSANCKERHWTDYKTLSL